ncbi:MAG: efflux transporter outer membrane subunit [Desulfobacterales bacterium]|nr:MAG: efflux transporter outer membrane subunit [Desulfobacterales bacterium]
MNDAENCGSVIVDCAKRSASQKRIRGHGLILTAWIYLATLSSCMVGPNYQPPRTQVPADWACVPAIPATLAEKALARWWTLFKDPTLGSLVERAVQSNLDLKLAEARIRQARSATEIALSAIGPTVDANGTFRRNRSAGSSGVDNSHRTTAVIVNDYQAGFDAGWELDIFGGVRRGIEAADADLQARVEARRDVLVTLTAEVARTYIDLRALQQRISIARKNLAAQTHTAELTRRRFQAGFVSALDVANADAQIATTAAQIPLLEASAQQSIYSLSFLLGLEPAALNQELSAASTIPPAPPATPLGLPSDLLRRRPDIRRAEAEIHAATARIGVAAADLFPRFTISGSVGVRASDFGSWFDWARRFWSFGPSASWNVFASGAIRANIEAQQALQAQSLITYRQAVLTALQEVENALIASAKEADHRKALVEAVGANRKAVALATRLYTEGQVDFLNVLNSQKSLYASEDALVQSTGSVSIQLVALYKALGGGWSENADAAHN